jgi:23S rRNA (guanosine2251-2'-O)-methyltransferase
MYILGRNPVIEALRAHTKIAKIYFRFGSHGEGLIEIRKLAKVAGVTVAEMPKQKFDRIRGCQEAQGVAALVEDVETVELEDLLAITREQDPPFFIALDSMQDPHNVGAIIRSAVCAGAHGVILSVHDSSMLTEAVVRASAGAVAHIPIAKVGNLHQTLLTMKERNIWIAGLAGDGDSDMLAFDADRPLCVVIGGEGGGMRALTRKTCDMVVRIPMWGPIDSLNASVASALMMYEVKRKRL